MLLYHATYNAYVESIKKYGLGGKQPKNWSFSQSGYLYFCIDPYCAESFAECSEIVEEKILNSGIIVYCINSEELDEEKIAPDYNVYEEETTCYTYIGIIPENKLKIFSITY